MALPEHVEAMDVPLDGPVTPTSALRLTLASPLYRGATIWTANDEAARTRHFRASALISTGADISAVSKELGLTTISVTSDMYGHLFEKASKRMARKAARLVPRAGTSAKSKKRKQRRDEAA